jgi:hypothetical protein
MWSKGSLLSASKHSPLSASNALGWQSSGGDGAIAHIFAQVTVRESLRSDEIIDGFVILCPKEL